MSDPRVSVIMPAHNAAAYLPRSLPPLLDGEMGADDVIVVDDASTDTTLELAKSVGARVIHLATNAGPSRARNAGAAAAHGDVLCFVDADVVLHPGAVRRMAEHVGCGTGPDAVFGSYDATPTAPGLVSRYRNLLHHVVHQAGRPAADTFWAGCGAIRRDAFEQIGGFDEVNYPRSIEDIELGYRLKRAGFSIHLDPAIQCTHLKALTLAQSLRTDILGRAIPWARLNLDTGYWPTALNITPHQKLAAALACGVGPALALGLLHPAGFLVALLCVLGMVRINRELFACLARHGGYGFALTCIPLHILHYGCAAIGLVAAWLSHYLGVPIPDRNTEQAPDR